MYKLLGMFIFIFILIWNVYSSNHKLVKIIDDKESTITNLRSLISIKKEELLRLNKLLKEYDTEYQSAVDQADILQRDLSICERKEPVIKWNTKIVTNPQYVKCIK